MEATKNLHVLIKLRHLKKSSENNWQILDSTKLMVNELIESAQGFMDKFGLDSGKAKFESDREFLMNHVGEVQELLDAFGQYIKNGRQIDIQRAFAEFAENLKQVKAKFYEIAAYPKDWFAISMSMEWAEIWMVIASNLQIVEGVGESAFLKALMIENFNATEIDVLTKEIASNIPDSFNLLEAEKYRLDYLKALDEIARETNAKANLWDRFLNMLAGNIPFKQSAAERVMMMRWVDGEKGEL